MKEKPQTTLRHYMRALKDDPNIGNMIGSGAVFLAGVGGLAGAGVFAAVAALSTHFSARSLARQDARREIQALPDGDPIEYDTLADKFKALEAGLKEQKPATRDDLTAAEKARLSTLESTLAL